MIECRNVTKKFGDKVAVDSLNLTLQDGTITGYIGPNGAGKTTTIKMMCGILEPTEGDIFLNGIDVRKEPIRAKEEYGFVSDSPDSFLSLKGIEYVNFICDVYRVPKELRKDRLEELLRDFEMKDAINDKIESYSHGMRQKIMIIAVLMHEPKIWILDEPLTGLDPQASYLLKQRMRRHAEAGNTVLFSTHVLEVAEKLCDQIVILNKGKVCYTGTLQVLQSQYPEKSLEEIFLEVTANEEIL